MSETAAAGRPAEAPRTDARGDVSTADERSGAGRATQALVDAFDRVTDGIVALDHEWRYTYVNRSAGRMFGRAPEYLVGKHIWTEFPEGVGQPFHAAYVRAYAEQVPISLVDYYAPWGRWFENRIYPSPDGLTIYFNDVTDSKRVELALQRSVRAAGALSELSYALIHCANETELLREVCAIVVESTAYRFAWVGYAEPDESHGVRPVARGGADDGYLDRARITWDESEWGLGPTGTAIRTGTVVVARDLTQDRDYGPWRVEALRRGFASSIALPLRDDERVFGSLNIYAGEKDAFDSDEVVLLRRLAEVLAYGIRALRERQARRLAESASAEALEMLRLAIDSIPAYISVVDGEQRYLLLNRQYEQWFGRPRGDVLGRRLSELHDAPSYDEMRPHIERAIRGETVRYEVWRDDAQGRRHCFDVHYIPRITRPGTTDGFFVMVFDVTAQKRSEEHIEYLAYFDPLTGLPNRALLNDRAAQAIARAERDGKQLAVMFIDFDNFKNINDSLGHSVGDEVLKRIAHRLDGVIRESDTLARHGGDEFAVLLVDAGAEHAMQIANRILEEAGARHDIAGRELRLTASIGISVFPDDARDFESLLKHADAAMYQAKSGGRNSYQFFTRAMNVAAFERLTLENSLRQALERQEFLLHYQPQIELSTRTIVGVEALLRWQHPQLGLVSPSKFIPVAEDCGLIIDIGQWVLTEACRQNRAWQDAGLPVVPVSVNVSPLQFRDEHLVAAVSHALATSQLAGQYLELELTERIMMQEAEVAVPTLMRLRDMGVHLAIDDFGTGYSNLGYLKRFPIHRLKIDQSFIRDIETDANDRAIIRVIISLGGSLGRSVVAEGVETLEQLRFLRDEGCEFFQGYLFAPPAPAAEIPSLLKSEHPDAWSLAS